MMKKSCKWMLPCFLVTALIFSDVRAQNTQLLLPESAEKRVRVPKFDIGDDWRSDVNYNDNGWKSVSGMPGGVGYEKNSGYEDLISLDVGFDMYETGGNPNTGCYIRMKFSLMQEQLERIDELFLSVRYDDGFVAFLNGERVAEANAPATLAFNSAATSNHEANGQEQFKITNAGSLLHVGENLLAVQALNVGLSSSDFLFNVEVLARENPIKDFVESNLPLLFIDTHGVNIPGRQNPDAPKIDATMRIVYHGVGQTHRLDDPANDYNGRIGIETRGSSSQSWPKKQYAVETRDDNGDNLNVSLMGLPKENDWILNAPFIDRSMLRNVLAYNLSRRMGHYASRTRYCELFLNGEYRGVYILMEKIKRDKNRVDIAALDSTDIEGDARTGGYILKIDKTDGANRDGFESQHLPAGDSNRHVVYQYHYPTLDNLLPEQLDYIQNFVYDFEDMMAGEQFNDPDSGYPAWIDVDSFIDVFIISELGKNVDAYRLSSFFYKDRDDKDVRLHAGPVWDYNLAFGLANYYDGTDTDDWMLETLLYMGGKDWQAPFWWGKLLDDPQFNHRIKQRWFSLRGNVLNLDRIQRFIDNVADTLAEAQERNFILWPPPGKKGTGFWPMPEVFYSFQSYQDEIDYLKNWIADRIAWMDENILLFSDVDSDKNDLQPRSFALYQNYPNPFNPSTTIRFDLDRAAHVRVEIFNVSGRKIKTALDQQLSAGQHEITWDGREDSGAPAATGVYILRAVQQQLSGQAVSTKKMTLLR